MLKRAATEEEEDKQTEYISSALAQISEVLPFSDKNGFLAEDRELLKHLLLLVPCYQLVDLVINSMLFKFQKNPDFLVNFQQSLENIASFQDNWKEIVENTAVETGNSSQSRNSSSRTKRKTINIAAVLRQINHDYNSTIKNNIMNLKRAALLYAKKLYDLFNALLKSSSFEKSRLKLLLEVVSPLSLSRIFVQFTETKEIMQKALKLLIDYKDVKEFRIDRSDIEAIGELIWLKTNGNIAENLDESLSRATSYKWSLRHSNTSKSRRREEIEQSREKNRFYVQEFVQGHFPQSKLTSNSNSSQEYFGTPGRRPEQTTPKTTRSSNETKKKQLSYQKMPSVIVEESDEVLYSESFSRKVKRSITSITSGKREEAKQRNKKSIRNFEDVGEESLGSMSSLASIGSILETDDFTEMVETWFLRSGPTPNVDNCPEFKEHLAKNRSLLAFIGLITEPFLYSTSFKWSKFHHGLKNMEKCLDITFHKSSPLEAAVSTYEDPKEKNPYYMRAQTALRVLTSEENYSFFLNLEPKLASLVFENVYHELKKEDSKADLKHLVHLLSYFIAKNPQMGLKALFFYHILFGLLPDLEFHFVREFFIRILSPSDHFFGFNQKGKSCIWKYCEATGLFPEMAQLIILPKTIEEIDKFDISFKLSDLNSLQEELDQGTIGVCDYLHFFTFQYCSEPERDPNELPEGPVDIDLIKRDPEKVIRHEEKRSSGEDSIQMEVSSFLKGEFKTASPKKNWPSRENKFAFSLPQRKEASFPFKEDFSSPEKSLYNLDGSSSAQNSVWSKSLESKKNPKENLRDFSLNGEQDKKKQGITGDNSYMLIEKPKRNFYYFKKRPESKEKSSESSMELQKTQRNSQSLTRESNMKRTPNQTEISPFRSKELEANKTQGHFEEVGATSRSLKQIKVILSKNSSLKERNQIALNLNSSKSSTPLRISSLKSLNPLEGKSPTLLPFQPKKIEMSMLDGNLYPLSQNTLIEIDNEIKSKALLISRKQTMGIEAYSSFASELLYFLALSGVEMDLFFRGLKLTGQTQIDTSLFWNSLINSSNARSFESIAKGFFGKLPHFLKKEESFNGSSAHYAGMTVNLLLKNLPFLQTLAQSKHEIMHIAMSYLPQIIKSVISINENGPRAGKLSLLGLEVASSFVYLVQNDKKLKKFESVPEVVFQILQNWFYAFKTNVFFQQTFTKLIEHLLKDKVNNSKVLVLFRMSAVSFLYNVSSQIFFYGMRVECQKLDSLVFSMSQITLVLFRLGKDNEELQNSLNQSQSWRFLTKIFDFRLRREPKKKEMTQVQSPRRSEGKQNTRKYLLGRTKTNGREETQKPSFDDSAETKQTGQIPRVIQISKKTRENTGNIQKSPVKTNGETGPKTLQKITHGAKTQRNKSPDIRIS